MVPPSQPVSGTDAKGEGHENSEAKGQIEDVKHCRSPEIHPGKPAAWPRKGAMWIATLGRKDRVKRRMPPPTAPIQICAVGPDGAASDEA